MQWAMVEELRQLQQDVRSVSMFRVIRPCVSRPLVAAVDGDVTALVRECRLSGSCGARAQGGDRA